jgi:aryl sulfotransferase
MARDLASAPAGIVWLASFPKSGNTWFRILLANLSSGERAPSTINDMDERGGIASSRREFEFQTLLDSGLLSNEDIDCLRPDVYRALAAEATQERWVKVHDAYTLNRSGEPVLGRQVARAAVYLVRDPRDVAVSLAHHNDTTLDDAILLMNASDGVLCPGQKGMAPQLRQKLAGWSGHVTSWLDQTDVPLVTVRYEDMLRSPAESLGVALRFAGRIALPAEIDRAVRHADFAELQRQERDSGFVERMSRTAPFFRAGRNGGWRDTLTSAQRHAIEQCHAAVMARVGYEL